ncbi:MAG TPA: hypothetical protein VLJ86_03350 [Ramlibacter sp.]|nr:hypothetical protein [Ramlibacter sp.]
MQNRLSSTPSRAPNSSTIVATRARRVGAGVACVMALLALPGCAVISVASTATSIAASGVGLAADAAIGTVRITGKAVGAAADMVIPDSSEH